jgi:hypothetical protein
LFAIFVIFAVKQIFVSGWAFLIVPCILRKCAIFREFIETRKKFEHTWGDNSRGELGESKMEDWRWRRKRRRSLHADKLS